jgi:elongation factor Ts
MAITAEMVKTLRDRTGAGMMDCKGALTEANGDIDAAIDILRKKGIAKAAKKAERSASDGTVATRISPDGTSGIIVEVNCETDFVARTDDFKALVEFVLDEATKAGAGATDAWAKDPAGPIQPQVAALVGKLGENMGVARIVRFADRGFVSSYIHMGGKIGVLVEATGVSAEQAATDAFKTLMKEVAMQVAAASPQFATRAEVPAELLDREKGIYRAQMEGSGKPANVIEKIIEGKLGSFYGEVVLPEQASIRDPKTKVADVIAAANKQIGATVTISRFVRLKVGESA